MTDEQVEAVAYALREWATSGDDFLIAARAAIEAYEAVNGSRVRILTLGSGLGVCIGGEWDGWMMRKLPDEQWVARQKLPEEGLPVLGKPPP